MKIRFLLIVLAALYLAGCSALGSQGLPLTGAVANTPVNAVQTNGTEQPEVTEQNGSEQQNGTNEQTEPTKAPEQNQAGESNNAAETPEMAQSTETNDQAEPTKAPEQNQAGEQNNQTPEPTEQTQNNNSLAPNGQAGLLYASQLLDYHAVDSAGNQLGEVKDLVINSSGGANGQVPYVVFSSSLRKDWYIPVPWNRVQVNPGMQTVVLPLNINQLNAAPGFGKDGWPVSFTAQSGVVQSFWANPGQAQAGAMGAMLGPAAVEHQATDYIRGNDLMDMKVLSQQGIKLGKIKDLALMSQPGSAQAGQFGYVVVELDESLGGNNLMVPVPWRLIHPVSGQDNLVVTIAPNILQSAPNFAKDMLPNLYSEPQNTQLNTYWTGK